MTTKRGGRDELSHTLTELRKNAGLSQVEAARQTEIGQRRISRFENGLYLPKPEELEALLRLYKAPREEVKRLREMIRVLWSQPRPSRVGLRRGNVASIQHQIKLIEANARCLEAFHPAIVLGLLQCPAYIDALFRQAGITDSDEAIAQRIERQRQMTDSDKRYTLIQSEGALRWQFASARVMAEQLDWIAERATSAENVRVGIVPWWRAVEATVVNGFHLYDRRMVHVGTESGVSLLRDPVDVEGYCALFDRISKAAVWDKEAARLARKIAKEYRKLI